MPSRSWPRVAVAAMAGVLVAALATGCSSRGGSGSSAACSPPVHEQLDSRSAEHLFPQSPDPSYLSDPPTSGPHRPGNHATGVLHEPIDPGVQVSMLENGAVILQYQAIAAAPREELEGLAGGPVSVAPGTDLPAPIVATAWTYKLSCRSVDNAAIERFVHAHAGIGANGVTTTTTAAG